MSRTLINYLLTSLALFIFISQSAFSDELITDINLKNWIKLHSDQLPGVVVNSDGGIDNTTANLEALAKIEELDCSSNSDTTFKLTSIDKLIRHMPNLKMLACVRTYLVELDLSKNTNLIVLDCSDNKLTNLDIANNIALTKLNCSNNQLTNLDISNNINLEDLRCATNQLINLDVSNNIKLKVLLCNRNQLANLDLSKNTNLIVLDCFDNQLTNLDITSNTELVGLDCATNQLTNLDVSNNIKLELLSCSRNQLTNLDIAKNITLERLYCVNNQLTNLDVSKHIELKILCCNDNVLNRLDVRSLLKLWELRCCNQAESFTLFLTNEQKSKFNEEHYCNAILLSTDFLITDPQLKEWIKLNSDKLPEVVVNEDGGITGTTANLEALAKIETLECTHFNLVKIDELIRHMPSLKKLECNNNSLIELDMIKNMKLESLNCNNNQLTKLDISLLKNLAELNCCNQAEDFILHLTNEQKSKFNEAKYCDAILYTELITDAHLKKWIKSNTKKLSGVAINEDGGIYGTTTNLEALAKIEKLDCDGSDLISIDELIRYMPNLKILRCSHKSLIDLDLSKNIELLYLECYGNKLTNLDLSKNIKLEGLACSGNQIKTLDLSKNIELVLLYCDKNQLTSLNISKNINLKFLYCCMNELTNLDVSNNIKLKELSCWANQLTNLDLSKNINLAQLDCFYNELTNLDVSNNINLGGLSCYNNQLTNLDVSNNIKLGVLWCYDNMLSSLDIRPLVSLMELDCCNQAEGFILYLTNGQKNNKNRFVKYRYCDAILKENGSICEIEWLDIYPNPTSDKFYIESKFFADEIKILNLAGEILYRSTLNTEKIEIDISNLPAGVYFVITKGKIGKVVKK